MKTISVRDLQKAVRRCVEDAQRDRVVVTRRGKPAAVMIGVEGMDWESLVLETDLKFWKMIQARRKETARPLREVKKRLRM